MSARVALAVAAITLAVFTQTAVGQSVDSRLLLRFDAGSEIRTPCDRYRRSGAEVASPRCISAASEGSTSKPLSTMVTPHFARDANASKVGYRRSGGEGAQTAGR